MEADQAPLNALLLAVNRARDKVSSSRGPANQANAGQAARAELLDALEKYVSALEGSRCPVPYALRDELRLRRGLRLSS